MKAMEIPKTREEIDTMKEKAANEAEDMKLAMFLYNHIENPCEVELNDGRIENIRHVYINEAKRALEELKNPFAVKLLEDVINKYTE